jgi:hypothetical protein
MKKLCDISFLFHLGVSQLTPDIEYCMMRCMHNYRMENKAVHLSTCIVSEWKTKLYTCPNV